MCKTFANQRQHAPATGSRGSRRKGDGPVTSVALISRNSKASGRLELRFLDNNNVEGVPRQKVSELKRTGTHSVCVPLKNFELVERRR